MGAPRHRPFFIGCEVQVHRIEHRAHAIEQFVVVGRALAGARHDCFEADGFRHRRTSHIERVDHCAEPQERRIRVQTKARQQHLERDTLADMSKGGTVEIEAERVGRAGVGRRQPYKARVAVDKPADQPRTCHPVNPHALAGRPGSPLILLDGQGTDCAVGSVRLAWREHGIDVRHKILPCHLGARGCFAREIVDRDDGLVVLAQAAQQLRQIGCGLTGNRLAGFGERPDETVVLVASVEERAKLGLL